MDFGQLQSLGCHGDSKVFEWRFFLRGAGNTRLTVYVKFADDFRICTRVINKWYIYDFSALPLVAGLGHRLQP